MFFFDQYIYTFDVGIIYVIEFKIELNSYSINDNGCSWLIDIFIPFNIGIFYINEFKII